MQTHNDINILAIDSSCDETAAAVVENGRTVKSNIISSQIALHEKYGGVVPELASRKHIELISYVAEDALKTAGKSLDDIDCIAVTYGPGLVGALLVGLIYAKSVALTLKKPFLGINHIEGHISANYLDNEGFEPPYICLVVSGGHTHLVYVKDYGVYEVLGRTRDDAAGEAFDKIARTLGLGYPGGPKLEGLAQSGIADETLFPRALLEEDSLDFSFSGLKSAVLNYLNQCEMKNIVYNKADVAASFQDAVTDILTLKTIKAAKAKGVNKIALSGGVACNGALRNRLQDVCRESGITFFAPKPVFCTDNAAMIGSAAYYRFIKGERSNLDLNAVPNLKL